MTSVARPVFDTKNDTLRKGILLGVMGTDVPLKELTKLTPAYKLGVNGYAFCITNNGYVLFHPDFRPMMGDKVKPNYNSVDLAEVELQYTSTDLNTADADGLVPNHDFELRRRMIDRETGNLTMEIKLHFDNMSRVAIRKNHYYFTDIDDTPFSLGIALADQYGLNYVAGRRNIQEFDLTALSPWRDFRLARWNYCRLNTSEMRMRTEDIVLKYLHYGIDKDSRYDKCDKELIGSLLFDAEVTRGACANWMKELRQGFKSDEVARMNGIEIVFIGTKGGLTRYLNLMGPNESSLTDPTILIQTNTIEELYYKRAVEQGNKVFTFSVPPAPLTGSRDPDDVVLTASSPIVISDLNGLEAVAAVVGLQMKYTEFYQIFMDATSVCHIKGHDCNLTCDDPELDCYLIDNNGFIVAAEIFPQVGMFFGEVEPAIMQQLVIDENSNPGTSKFDSVNRRGVFKQVKLLDYQGTCEQYHMKFSAASPGLLNPFSWLFNVVSSFFNELTVFLIQYNVMSWWTTATATGQYGGSYQIEVNPTTEFPDNLTMQPVVPKDDGMSNDYSDHLEMIYQLKVPAIIIDQIKEEYTKLLAAKKSRDYRTAWTIKTIKPYQPKLIGHYTCPKTLTLFMLAGRRLQMDSSVQNCSEPEQCQKSFTAHPVPYTNLMLVAVDATCQCYNEPLSIKAQDVSSLQHNDTLKCMRLQNEVYRKRPSECYAYHPQEDSSNCGRGDSLRPCLQLIGLIGLLLTLSHPRV